MVSIFPNNICYAGNPEVVKKVFASPYHNTKTIEVELFTWEKLDYVETIRKAFGL